jgi:hypothetical protein
MTITDTCKCGAQFSVATLDDPFAERRGVEQHDRWLKAHEYCRIYLLIKTTTTLPEVQAMEKVVEAAMIIDVAHSVGVVPEETIDRLSDALREYREKERE